MVPATPTTNREWDEMQQTLDAMKALEALKAVAAQMEASAHPLAALVAAGRWEALDRLLAESEAA